MFNIDRDMIPFFMTATLLTVIFIFFMIASLVQLKNRQIKKERELLQALVGERERTMYTISVEIHDNINQMLNLARMTLKMINKYSVAEQRKYINESENILDSAINDLRNISHSLNAEYLKNRGLYESLLEEVSWVNAAKKINCSLEAEGELKFFEQNTELMLIRIAQEAIHNTLKHADAKNLYIQLKYKNDQFQMVISDDGLGFSVNPQLGERGVGLQSIYQRSRIINSHVEVKSEVNMGTEIRLTILNPAYTELSQATLTHSFPGKV